MGLWVTRFLSHELGNTVNRNQVMTYTLNEVAQHHQLTDCWIIIHGKVYDLTTYLPQHPTSLEVVLTYCGKEATSAYNTKNVNKPHSDYANQLLEQYWIGVLSH